MRRKSQVIMAALTAAAIGASLIVATPAVAVPPPPSCPELHICLYEHTNFNRRQVGKVSSVHVSALRNCARVFTTPGNGTSSVANNTDSHIELWDTGSHPDYLVGTTVRRKAYTDLGNRGNDATDMIVGIHCYS